MALTNTLTALALVAALPLLSALPAAAQAPRQPQAQQPTQMRPMQPAPQGPQGPQMPGQAQQPQAIDRIAVVVNEDLVTVQDLEQRVSMAILSSGLADGIEVRRRVTPQVLHRLVDEKLQLQEAERLKLSISDAELDKGVASIEQQNHMPAGGFDQFLRQAGVDPKVGRQQIKADLAWIKVVRQTVMPTVRVSDEEVDERLAAIRSSFGSPENLVAEIFLPIERASSEEDVHRLAERLFEQLQSGAPFPALARQFSQSVTAAAGGDLGWVQPGMLAPEVETAVAKMHPGDLAVVPSTDGLHIVLLRERRDPAGTSDTDSVALAQLFFPLAKGAQAAERQAAQAKAEQLAGPVRTCDDMERVARTERLAQSGRLGRVRTGELPEALRPVIEAAPLSQATRPIEGPAGISVFMVCERGAAGPAVPTRLEMQGRMENERGEMLARRYLRDLRRSAYVDVRI